MVINGTMVWYSQICERQVWLIGHSIEPFQENEKLEYGRAIHELYYQEGRKEILIDNAIKIDLLRNKKIVAEIKSSSKSLKSARLQLLYYLYYLKHEKGVLLDAQILVPTERKKINVRLDESSEREVESVIERIRYILSLPVPPKPVKVPYCRNCAYKDMCWA